MKKTLLALSIATLASATQAEQFWADTSLSMLKGGDYEFAEDTDITTVTVEHVSGHSWGGLFMFVDNHNGESYSEVYGEISPKISLTKGDGLVSAVNLAYTYEFGSLETDNADNGGYHQSINNHLVGLGADLNISGMDFASVTLYQAYNDGEDTNDQQVTVTYGWSSNNITLDGYIDYAFNNEDENTKDNLHFNPQLTYNLGSLFDSKSKLKAGIEYSYWENQFGIEDKNQEAISLLVKAHF